MIKVYWWSRAADLEEDLENFGDILVPYILSKTTTEKFQWMVPNENRYFRILNRKRHYLIIGSILRKATKNSIVWGAGIMFQNSVVAKAKFLLVRGPETRNRLLNLGYKVPEKYGDPGLLIALFNKRKINKKYKLGIVPHYLDEREVRQNFAFQPSIKIISLLTRNPQDVIDEINDCEMLLSSSLHGIITGHALGIPTLWFKVSDRLLDDIKFYDYYQSVGIDYQINNQFCDKTIDKIKKFIQDNSCMNLPRDQFLKKRIMDLIETFPFEKSNEFKKAIKVFFK